MTAGSTFQAKYDFRCRRSEVSLIKNVTLLAEYLAILFAGDTNDVFPYGVDPVFLRSSAALYEPDLQDREGWFYNMSDHLEVPQTTGTPYGFFHRPLKVNSADATDPVLSSGRVCSQHDPETYPDLDHRVVLGRLFVLI